MFGWFRRRDVQTAAEEAFVDDTVDTWGRACSLAGLSQTIDTVSGGTEVIPRIEFVAISERYLVVRLLPGQLPSDFTAVADRLAYAMGAAAIRVEPRGKTHVIIWLLDRDPLAETVPMTYAADGGVFLGRTEDGADLVHDFRREAHMIVQGVTRSGKSVLTYAMLAALSRQPDVICAGIDPTGLLWRPFVGTRHEEYQVSGLDRLERHEALLTRLVSLMDQRIEKLPRDRDTIEISTDNPMIVVVLEELAALYRAVDSVDPKQGKRIRALIGRILAEGAKVGFRAVLLVQRAEAAVVGSFERAMCSTRISFRCDNRASVELLHPGTDPVIADAHTTAAPGVALLSTPGRPLTRVRAPWFGSYSKFAEEVQQ
jgi:S-DNA-T family DNA segregation ATPase FtsK/SpoIIIE